MNIKKFVLFIVCALSVINISNAERPLDWCYPRYFDVTGYYSPIKWQPFYYRGNFARETRLNGQGIAWASGKEVFNGMIAASPNYGFGTKIYFPDHGWGQVEDRGQAIVQAWVRNNRYDRIDIRMGHGTKWLIRALSFGKRTMKWYVCPSSKPYVGFDYGQFPIYNDFFKASLWWVGLGQWRSDEWVEILQYFLHQLGYVSKNHITWYFGPITDQAVCKFQQDQNIRYWNNCWYFGPQTRQRLKDTLEDIWYLTSDSYRDYYMPNKQGTEDVVQEQKEITSTRTEKELDEWVQDEVAGSESEDSSLDETEVMKEDKEIVFERSFQRGEESYEVTELQEYLSELGYYDGELDGKYDMETIRAVYQFQLDYDVLDSDSDPSVKGYFGSQTRKQFANIVASI